MAEMEAKLDEDFLFYLGFINTFMRRMYSEEDYRKARVWLYKLIVEPNEGIERKRCRNMYLAQLLICMQNGKIEQPFLQRPIDVDISNAMEVFGPIPETVEKPAWLNDSEYAATEGDHVDRKGRTYLATRTLPNGQGAFAYIGVSLTDDEPMFQIGAGAAGDSTMGRAERLEQQMAEKFREYVPPVYEMEKILAKRKDPKEREKVLTFYDVLLQNIADELDGKGPTQNETVEGLLEQLIEDLQSRDQYAQYENLSEDECRTELLLMLYDRVKARRDKVAKREEVLDDIEQKVMPESFFETSIQPDDKYELPAAMWQQAINKIPTRSQIERLQIAYPVAVMQKFIDYLTDYKAKIAKNIHRRHERIIMQMKKELRKEGVKIKEKAEDITKAYERAEKVHKEVKAQYIKKMEIEEANKGQMEIPLSEHSKLYEKMKAAIYDQQRLVEEEAARGKFLASQINQVSEQNKLFHEVNDEMMKQAEDANLKIMRNIKRMNIAVKAVEDKIAELRTIADSNLREGDEGEEE